MFSTCAVHTLWAKKSRNDATKWLPLRAHLADAAGIAKILWNHWISDGMKAVLVSDTGTADEAEAFLVFLAAAHDIGKATPVFQAKPVDFHTSCDLDRYIAERTVAAGLPLKPYSTFTDARATPHALATELILSQNGASENVAVILGAHHGKPLNHQMLNRLGPDSQGENFHLGREGKAGWTAVQQNLIDFALQLAGFPSLTALPRPTIVAQVLYSGLVVMADWIASNDRLFPYISVEDTAEAGLPPSRIWDGWNALRLPDMWSPGNLWAQLGMDLYKTRFQIDHPYPMQSAIAQWLQTLCTPGIAVLEAPMGRGKTEAALVMAEAFANLSGRTGVFFALPTQATSNAIFSRLYRWTTALGLEGAGSIRLAHGKAQLNTEYRRLFEGSVNIGLDEQEGAQVNAWFEGNKKALLADFVVGTIDQLLLAALRQKHVMLRHLGLGNKVVILDECHAYDAYMSRYLERALRWLGRYGVPVIVLSATLPGEKRQTLIEAYRGKPAAAKPVFNPFMPSAAPPAPPMPAWVTCREYPLLTYTDRGDVHPLPIDDSADKQQVQIEHIPEDSLPSRLEALLADGGYAGIIVNTVGRAQKITATLREHFGNEQVTLLHSRFLAPDRAEMEKALLRRLGKQSGNEARQDRYIVVGTQVMEQSLDIDFDVLASDLCPMDLLLQRIGRLHRHVRARPSALNHARCLVLGAQYEEFEAGSRAVYGEYLLMRTRALLPDTICLPSQIPDLVQNTYDDTYRLVPEPAGYAAAKGVWLDERKKKEQRAEVYRIEKPFDDPDTTMIGWLDMPADASEKGGQAAVRDGDESIEVLAVYRDGRGDISFLPWIENGRAVAPDVVPDAETARLLACQSIRLPHALCRVWSIEQTIHQLEESNALLRVWQESAWLKGELFLLFDEELSVSLNGYCLHYDREYGLTCIKEENVNGE